MHHPPNCLYQVLLVRVYTDLQAPSTHSFLRLVLNVFFIQHIFLLLSGPQLPAVLFPSLHISTTTCTFTHTLTTHSTLFTCCALSGQYQHHLYSHPGTHTSIHIYRWAKINDIPMLPSSNICSQILRSYLWWSLCILYLLAFQAVQVFVVHVTCFER